MLLPRDQQIIQWMAEDVSIAEMTITKEWEGYTINADIAFADVDPEKYLGILFSGGRAQSTFATTKT